MNILKKKSNTFNIMKREIKFRAIQISTGKMIESMTISRGHTKLKSYNYYLEIGENDWTLVDADTISQYTGLKDRNGKEIYEGDIYVNPEQPKAHYQVMFLDGCWAGGKDEYSQCPLTLESDCDTDELSPVSTDWIEVVGNIYENPDLMNPLTNK